MKKLILIVVFLSIVSKSHGEEHSIAREWNELLLQAITNDWARPTVHARNLHHFSIVTYDAWAAYEPSQQTFFLGQGKDGFHVPFDGVSIPEDTLSAREKAISFACYRLFTHRFQSTPGNPATQNRFDDFMDQQGYDASDTSTNYVENGPSALGNYLAKKMIEYGLQDGANEPGEYENQFYEPVNPPIYVDSPGTQIIDPNRWQAISLKEAIDQAGNPVESTPPHLSPEWGNVNNFALKESDKNTYARKENEYHVFHDPGPPPYIDTTESMELESFYKWGFTMVPVWQSHLDPADTTMIDISPNSMGNIQNYPETFDEYKEFYDFFNGGDNSQGYDINPATGDPYSPQFVKRADLGRVKAEYWADGLDSETPPGHWFNIYNNQVSDDSLFSRKWKGEGKSLNKLEYDVKAYFILGGAVHDAAVSAWSIKGWYDYVRPVSAIRYMAQKGQSTDSEKSNYHPAGIPLIDGFVEIIDENDPLVGDNNQFEGEVKLYTWKGPDHVEDRDEDTAGVGWIRAVNWWPYQNPEFVTPPFAGYISGHSTFSRAAAEVLTEITGDPFFPGGKSNMLFEADNYLEFENGPSEDIYLQYATYRDAADGSALSRIWGGIHPPADDIPGRLIGKKVGIDAFNLGNQVIENKIPAVKHITSSQKLLNRASFQDTFTVTASFNQNMDTAVNPRMQLFEKMAVEDIFAIEDQKWKDSSHFQWILRLKQEEVVLDDWNMQVSEAKNHDGIQQRPYVVHAPFVVNTVPPYVAKIEASHELLNVPASSGYFELQIEMNENADTTLSPAIAFDKETGTSLQLSDDKSFWTSPKIFNAVFKFQDNNERLNNIGFAIDRIKDAAGNEQLSYDTAEVFSINTIRPKIENFEVSKDTLNIDDAGPGALQVHIAFNEVMDVNVDPGKIFNEILVSNSLSVNRKDTEWIDNQNLQVTFDMINAAVEFNADAKIYKFVNQSGNPSADSVIENVLYLDTRRPEIIKAEPEQEMITAEHKNAEKFKVKLHFSETMRKNPGPFAELTASEFIDFNVFESYWIDDRTFQAVFDIEDRNFIEEGLGLKVQFGQDLAGNELAKLHQENFIDANTSVTPLVWNNESRSNLNFYPNPVASEGEIKIESDHAMQFLKLEMRSIYGKKVYSQTLSSVNSNDASVKFNGINPGIYLIKIKTEAYVLMEKIIIK